VVLSAPACLSFHATGRVLVSTHDVDEKVLIAETTVALTDKARDADVSWPYSVEPELVELPQFRSADNVHPVGITVVLQETSHSAVVVVVDAQAEGPTGGEG